MLEIKNISKTYGSGRNAFQALTDVNINFGSKGLIIILGKSGCGKSTLLNIIGGMDTPTQGEVIINGRSTKNFKKSEFDSYRNTFVGIVFQEFNLIDDISVFDNINMTMKLQEKNTDVNTVDEALAMVGLSNLGYRKPSELSGGQRQRVSLARALLKKPEIILADEPTGALDSATGEEVFETLKKIALDKLVIVVTHNRELAHAYGDRIIEISDGQIISDKVRADGSADVVKDLPGGVIEVASTGEITADELNKKLDKKKTNYIGLSHDKDRIALAYPDTVDSFYSQADTTVFSETKEEDIPTDSKEFKLSKGGITLKESIKLARGNIKRHKKRFRFINVIASLCFIFISLGLVVGTVNVPSLIARTAFDTPSTMVQAGHFATSEYGYVERVPSKLNGEQIDEIKQVVGENVGYGALLYSTPELAVTDKNAPTSSQYEYYRWDYDASFDFSYFNGVVEVDDITNLGMTVVAGKSSCDNLNEIIISDFAAYMLGKKGFIGADKDGRMDVRYLPDVESIIDYSIYIKQTKKLYKVAGVFKTDYQKYASLSSGIEQYSSDKADLQKEFTSLYSYDYRKIFGATGLANALSTSGSLLRVSIYGDEWTTGDSVSLSDMVYDKTKLRAPDDYEHYNMPSLVWSQSRSGSGYVAPETLADNEMIVPIDIIRNLSGRWDISSNEEFIASSDFTKTINKRYDMDFSGYSGSGRMLDLTDMKIVGVVEGGYSNNGSPMFFSKGVADKLASASGGYEYLYFNRGSTASSLENKVSDLKDRGFSVGSPLADISSIREFDSVLATMGKVFLYIALGFFVFAFFVIFNYMATSVRFRTKEIAVYRVIGAKSTDIAKIFLAEGAGIVIISSIVAIIFGFLLSLFLNYLLGSILSMFGLTFAIIRFNWLIEPLAIILGSAFTVALSSLLPVLRVTTKRPVEALKLI